MGKPDKPGEKAELEHQQHYNLTLALDILGQIFGPKYYISCSGAFKGDPAHPVIE